MVTEIILPQLGDTMDEATITRWFKREGDAVKKGEPLFEVLTDKANIEVEATTSGFLRKVLHGENETVPTGKVIAYMTAAIDEALDSEKTSQTKGAVGTKANPQVQGEPSGGDGGNNGAAVAASPSAVDATGAPRRKQFVSPRARRVAQEFGIDVSKLSAASKTGRVMEADVRRFLAQQAPPAPPALSPFSAAQSESAAIASFPSQTTVHPVTGVRKVIFERMGASAREIARVTLATEADATRLVELRAELNSHQSEMKFSYTDYFVLLVSRALLKFPYMNATLHEDGVHHHASVNMGIAADTERGLLVPVLRDAQTKGLGEIYTELRRLSEGARTGKIAPDDLRGGTFTLTNLGAQEIDAFTPIVNQPEIAILGTGRIAQKPAAYQGQLALRWMVTLSLSFDHRVVDGAPAGRFLQYVKQLIETPSLLLI